MRSLASYVLTGRVQAIGIAAALLGLSLVFPPVGLLSSAVVALITLRLGSVEGLKVIGVAALVSALLGGLLVGGVQGFIVYGGFVWLPVWLAASVLHGRVDLALALETVVVLTGMAVIGVYINIANPAELWSASVEFVTQRLLENPPPELDENLLREQVAMSARYWTGAAAALALVGVTMALFVARWWQAQLFNPGGFFREYLALRGHHPLAYVVLALLLAASMTAGQTAELARNLLVVGGVFYSRRGGIAQSV